MDNSYIILAPENSSEDLLRKQPVLLPFDSAVMAFIAEISDSILKNHFYRQYPELVAMAFWMRKANITRLKSDFENEKGSRLWLGRGTVFHIAPSNVDTIFIYSWFLSMLVGNINIVRISSKLNEPVEMLVKLINEVSEKADFAEIKNRFLIIQYEHNDEITGHFSSMCDIRVIWGGDETIKRIRQIPLSPTATELVFADKFSFSLIDADTFLSSEKDDIVIKFFNDAFWFGQNACSSPRMVVWVGVNDTIKKAQDIFWNILSEVVQKKLENAPAVAVRKLVSECALAIDSGGDIHIENSDTSLINRVAVSEPADIVRDNHCGGGLFYELKICELNDLQKILRKKDQTISVYGFDSSKLRALLAEIRPEGVNRVVPLGQSLDFSRIWDGYDLLREFCREIDVASFSPDY